MDGGGGEGIVRKSASNGTFFAARLTIHKMERCRLVLTRKALWEVQVEMAPLQHCSSKNDSPGSEVA